MCKYCDFKKPTMLETHRTRCDQVGRKPLVFRNDEVYGREGIWLGHREGNEELGLSEYYSITFWEAGHGFYSKINFCPMCGRDLWKEAADD